MQRHLGMHGALIAGMLAVFGLSALGVAVPSGIFLLLLLACPLMMMVMMMGGMDHGGHGGNGGHQGGSDQPRPPHDHESMR